MAQKYFQTGIRFRRRDPEIRVLVQAVYLGGGPQALGNGSETWVYIGQPELHPQGSLSDSIAHVHQEDPLQVGELKYLFFICQESFIKESWVGVISQHFCPWLWNRPLVQSD